MLDFILIVSFITFPLPSVFPMNRQLDLEAWSGSICTSYASHQEMSLRCHDWLVSSGIVSARPVHYNVSHKLLKNKPNPKQGRYRSLSSPVKLPKLPQLNHFSEIFTIVFPVQEPVVNSIEATFVSGFFHLFSYFYCMTMSQFIRFPTKSINESELWYWKVTGGETQLPLAPNAFFSPFTPASISSV